MIRLVLVSGLLVALAGGCSEAQVSSSDSTPSASAKVNRKEAAGGKGAPSAAPSASGLPRVDFQEVEFGESERSRDPFRSYAAKFVEEARNTTKSQRQVVLEGFGIDELRLVGIVSGVVDARAMLLDPQGLGHVVHRGQFVGRAEIVRGDGQGARAYEVNWRIDRIRDEDIVLVREDPKNPEVPTATRVLTLHPEGEVKAGVAQTP